MFIHQPYSIILHVDVFRKGNNDYSVFHSWQKKYSFVSAFSPASPVHPGPVEFISVHLGPFSLIRVHPGSAGSNQVNRAPSKSKQVFSGPSGFSQVHPGPTGLIHIHPGLSGFTTRVHPNLSRIKFGTDAFMVCRMHFW